MKHISNNPINLHFYNPEEQLPDNMDLKIVVCRTKKGVLTWNRAYYDGRFWVGSGSMSGVIAWATFSPEWVVSETDRDIFGCK